MSALAAVWTATLAFTPSRLAFACSSARCSSIRCEYRDDDLDSLVLYGDAGVLVGYGTVQGLVDYSLGPLAQNNPDLFTQNLPVIAAPFQGILIAALWVLITQQLNGYSTARTRTLPSRAAVIPLVVAWLGSSAVLLATLASAGLPLDAEIEFVLGSATVIAGWRFLYSNSLPIP